MEIADFSHWDICCDKEKSNQLCAAPVVGHREIGQRIFGTGKSSGLFPAAWLLSAARLVFDMIRSKKSWEASWCSLLAVVRRRELC